MKCPVCNIDLLMSERQGIEIDYCSQCRGIWLDRGELDKIIERSSNEGTDLRERGGREERGRDERGGHEERGYDRRDYPEEGHRKKRRGSFLGDLFEFGD